MRCIVCRTLISFYPGTSVPDRATELRSLGNALSSVTNDTKGDLYSAYVCDACMKVALENDGAEKAEYTKQGHKKPKRKETLEDTRLRKDWNRDKDKDKDKDKKK